MTSARDLIAWLCRSLFIENQCRFKDEVRAILAECERSSGDVESSVCECGHSLIEQIASRQVSTPRTFELLSGALDAPRGSRVRGLRYANDSACEFSCSNRTRDEEEP